MRYACNRHSDIQTSLSHPVQLIIYQQSSLPSMCHFRVYEYTLCGCRWTTLVSSCFQGDGELTCYGNPKYEKIVERSACGRDECPLKGLYDKIPNASRGE